ncbi:14-3-3 protein [Histomonas meleagridis]|uniref:14-3-3 protein n=1 Tax=Histomonas meleagridis TaxID=135588 RepID=UPI003559FDE7|nr:14-3-3 protein [Histomonas meleagridis]KAH0797963.1 14-3-3 protein [Histomonas meleagridis]
MASDLLFYANVQHDISRYEESLSYLKEFISQKSNLNKKERAIFGLIYKDAIDQTRNTLRILSDDLGNKGAPEQMAVVQRYFDKSLNELNIQCNEALSIINDTLLPSSDDLVAKAFYYKMAGDLYRYMYEFSQTKESSYLQSAETEYNKAIEISSANLPFSHPVRLGSILNYSVFLYEHCHNREKAIELVKTALSDVEKDTTTLSKGTQLETIDVINVMQKNLEYWDMSLQSSDEGDDE